MSSKPPVPPQLRNLKSIPDSDKIKIFDELYKMCQETAQQVIKDASFCDDNNDVHYIYEHAMRGTLGSNIFTELGKWVKIGSAWKKYQEALGEVNKIR